MGRAGPRSPSDGAADRSVLDATDSPDIMASIDSSSSRSELVIADVSRENAWVSVDETDATVPRRVVLNPL